MDALGNKHQEAAQAFRTADEAATNARVAYLHALEVSFTKLKAFNAAGHEILVALSAQNQALAQNQKPQENAHDSSTEPAEEKMD